MKRLSVIDFCAWLTVALWGASTVFSAPATPKEQILVTFHLQIQAGGSEETRPMGQLVTREWHGSRQVEGRASLQVTQTVEGEEMFWTPNYQANHAIGSLEDGGRVVAEAYDHDEDAFPGETVTEDFRATGDLGVRGLTFHLNRDTKQWRIEDFTSVLEVWESELRAQETSEGKVTRGDGTTAVRYDGGPWIGDANGQSFGIPGRIRAEAFYQQGEKDPTVPAHFDVDAGNYEGSIQVSKPFGTLSFSWSITRKIPEVEVIVSGPDYQDWRPDAAPGPTKGTPLALEAQLRSVSAEGLSGVKVKEWKWTLQNTSREPGIALNFPLGSNDRSHDLRLASAKHTLGENAQSATRTPQSSDTFVDEIKIEPYDWGAWSDLQVQAELDDGRIIKGHFYNQPKSATTIPLPARTAGHRIARTWLRDHQVGDAPDNDDKESSAAGLRNANGDGFTLYEEYRGFYEDGKHIEGDPLKKDFFVGNEVGDDALAGIALFAQLSQLTVHSRVRIGEEFDPKNTQMNRNRAEGAQRVKQHGVHMATDKEVDGGETRVVPGKATRPHLCKGIRIQPRGAAGKTLTRAYHEPASDRPHVYDRAVAHELFHSIGVDHHGDGDSVQAFYFAFADEPTQPRAKDEILQAGKPVRFRNESDNRDITDELCAAKRRAREKEWEATKDQRIAAASEEIAATAGLAGGDPRYNSLNAEQRARHKLNMWCSSFTLLVGPKGGESSGNDQCVLRYYFCSAFESIEAGVFYYINGEPDPAGRITCNSATGTGVNKPLRKPEPRFGNASAGRGDCLHHFCVNDAIP